MECVAPTDVAPFATLVALVMEDAAEDPGAGSDTIFGTTLINPGGAQRPTSSVVKGPLPPPFAPGTTIAYIPVVCLVANDISLTKADTVDPVVAAGSFQYTLTVNNPSATTMNVDIADTLSGGGTITAVDNGPACSFTASTVTCADLSAPTGDTVVTVDVSVSEADACATLTNTALVTLDSPGFADPTSGPGSNNEDIETTDVACTDVDITKAYGPVGGPYTGDGTETVNAVVEFQYCVTNGTAANSTASDVAVTDSNLGPIGNTGPIAGGAAAVCLVSGPVSLLVPGNICNTATANPTNGTQANAVSNQVCIVVATAFPPFNGIAKDTGNDPEGFSGDAACNGIDDDDDGVVDDGCFGGSIGNLFLTKPLTGITITEVLQAPNDVDTCNDDDDGDGRGCIGNVVDCDGAGPGTATCPVSESSDWDGDIGDLDMGPGEVGEGVGAFEFQIKFDHKLWLHPTVDCGDVLDVDAAPGEGAGRNTQPVVDVITENWILIGCVSKNVDPADPSNGPDIDFGMDGVTVTFNPQPDLLERIRPTKDNGIRADLLDENCEIADTLGSPYNMDVEPNGSNDAPSGGLTEDCHDAMITIRMLEGDIDLDCDVDVVDDQMIAFRYGATFGVLSYDPFFDLEPNTTPTDFDIDIKDLQFVFGRNGSTCDNPIPDQLPQVQIPDP
jgi:hypothetical protein